MAAPVFPYRNIEDFNFVRRVVYRDVPCKLPWRERRGCFPDAECMKGFSRESLGKGLFRPRKQRLSKEERAGASSIASRTQRTARLGESCIIRSFPNHVKMMNR